MKKAVVLLIPLVVLIVVFVYARQRIGDLRPSIVPSTKSVQSTIDNLSLQSPKFKEQLPGGFQIGLFADVPGARAMAFSSQNTLIVSQTGKGKVTAIWENNGAVEKKEILNGLQNPHGIAFYQGKLYLAEEERVVRYSWNEQNKEAIAEKTIVSLPKGGRHFTRSIVFNSKGQIFISIGSTCDVCIEKDDRIGIVVSDNEGAATRVYAKGLRNSPFITINLKTDELWATEMGRDFLGDETPPDEVNIIQEGKNYGWPYCYGNKIYDTQFGQETPAFCKNTTAPVFEIPAHSAPLGLTFINSKQFPAEWQGDLLVAYHGSWNRSTPTGYKVVHMKVNENTITGADDFLTGFIEGSDAAGRPVDLVFDTMGNLYVSDDKAGAVYRISKQ